jgi:glycosyltransferase involved in cell wall biosynthesis
MPSRSPAISVVIPTRNRHSMLADAIASVLRQDFDGFEIVVIDDGVGAAEFIGEWFAAERSIRCADNAEAGQVRARNLGVSLARGEVVAFLDDDDRWGSNSYLSATYAAIAGQPAATLASGDVVIVDDNQRVVETIPFAASTSPEAIRRDNKILVTLPIYWDWDWYLRLHAAGVAFHDLGPQGVMIAAHRRATSGEGHSRLRADNLALLSAKHGLGPLTLRNHESIARDEAAGR